MKSGRLRAGAVRAPPDAHVRVEDEAWARTLNAAAAICLKSRRGHVLLRARVDHASPMRQLALHLPHHKPIQLLAADAQVVQQDGPLQAQDLPVQDRAAEPRRRSLLAPERRN